MAKIKIVESADKFLALVKKSDLVPPEQLVSFAQAVGESADPVTIARELIKKGLLTRWQASQMLSGYFQLSVGKYRLCDQIGKGELGTVYLAENAKLGKQVALKVLSKKHTDNPQLVERFLEEARAAAALDHRNIIHVHDIDIEAGRHYVVMEYVEGLDLAQQVQQAGPLPVAEAVDVIRQAVEGLKYAHEQGILHRDIKPANLKRDASGVVKILDMGVGQLRAGNATLDNTGELVLSGVSYMSPEQARGGPVDARSDVYSLGCTLYFLLTGREPFSTTSEAERTQIKETRRALPIQQLRAEVAPSLGELCDRLMAFKADDRLASMREVGEALAACPLTAAASSSPAAASPAAASPAAASADKVAPGREAAAVPGPETPSQPEPRTPAAAESTSDESDQAKAPGSATIQIKLEGVSPTQSVSLPADFSIKKKSKKKDKEAPAAKAAEAAADSTEPAAKTAPVAKPDAKGKPAAADVKPASGSSEKVDAALTTTAGARADVAPASKSAGVAAGAAPAKSKMLLIVGAVAGGLLLVAIGIGVGVMVGGGGEQVAQTKGEEAKGDAKSPPSDEEAAAEAPPAETAADASAASSPADASAAAANPAAGTEATTAVAAATPAAEPTTPAANAPVAEAPAAPAAPAPAPSEPMPSEPSAGEPPAATPAGEPEKKAPEKEAPANPEPEKKEPEKKEPEKKATPPKPAPKAPPAQVFEMAAAVDLPAVAGDDSGKMSLGKVLVGAKDNVFISLFGGDYAARARGAKFTILNGNSGTAPRDWDVFLSEASGEPLRVATLALPEQELQFGWTAEAASNANASSLRNCSLKVTAGQAKPHELSLRTPVAHPPTAVELAKASVVKWDVEGAPNPASIKVEIAVLGQKFAVDPPDPIPVQKGQQWVYLGEVKEQSVIWLKVEPSLNARGVQIEVEPHFFVGGAAGEKPLPLNKANLKKFKSAELTKQRQLFESQLLNFRELAKKKENLQRIQNPMNETELNLRMADEMLQRVQQLETQTEALQSGITLSFRVFADSFDKQIDLAVTDPKLPAEK